MIIFVRNRKRSPRCSNGARYLHHPHPPDLFVAPGISLRCSGFSLPFTFIVDAPALCTRCARAVFVIRWSDAIVIRGTSKRLKIRSRHLSSFRLISHSNFIYCRENKFNGIITRSPSITSPLCGEFYFQTIALRE